MSWIDAALWGVLGSCAVEGLDCNTAVRRHGRWPWRARGPHEVGAFGYVVAELIRLIIGGVLAAAAVSQFTGPVGALAVGIAAPLIVERLARAVPLVDSVPETDDSQEAPNASPATCQHPVNTTRESRLTRSEHERQRRTGEDETVYTDAAEQVARYRDRPERLRE